MLPNKKRREKRPGMAHVEIQNQWEIQLCKLVECECGTVWPDIETKSSQIFSKSCIKLALTVFT